MLEFYSHSNFKKERFFFNFLKFNSYPLKTFKFNFKFYSDFHRETNILENIVMLIFVLILTPILDFSREPLCPLDK